MGLLELSLKIIFCLLIAGIIGWIVGFLLGRVFGSANATELLREGEAKLRVRETELQGLRAELAMTTAKMNSLQTELSTLATTIKTRDGWITEMEEQQKELQADLDARISELDELKAESDTEKARLKEELAKATMTQKAEVEQLKVRVAEAEGALKLEKSASQPGQQDAATATDLRSQLAQREAEITGLRIRITELEFLAREVKEPPSKTFPVGAKSESISDHDDLKKVFGIGPVLEKLLNEHGIYWFHQIAKWGPEEIQRYDSLLENFRGRIEREGWVASAKEEHRKKYGERLQ